MGTIKADTVTGLADPNKATIPNTITMGSTTATLNFGNTVITNASAGSTTVTAEGGSTTTNLQQGLCKVWSTFELDAISLEDSFNLSSHSNDAAGRTTLTFTNNFSNVDYAFCGTVFDGQGANDVRTIGHDNGTDTNTTSALKIYTVQEDGTLNTSERLFSHFMGDLA